MIRNILLTALMLTIACIVQARPLPSLITEESRTQLLVNGNPYLILGGELGNSSASTMAYMEPIWPKLREMNVNTLLTPIYWDLIEPQPNQFDFALVEKLIKRARKEDIKLVLLWFGSWKNSMSCYVPSWIKRDQAQFPRATDIHGNGQEILTPFSNNNLEADKKAFIELMTYIKKIDSKANTVIMVQVENEIGMLPDARDYFAAANTAFSQQVPAELMAYLQANKQLLTRELLRQWENSGFATTGSWEEVFGKSLTTDEIFIAWHFARYTNTIASAGKAIYHLPMYVNAALNRPGVEPGKYPSGGPLPHLMDIWKAGAPDIDLLAPDFYNPDFKYWNDRYTQQGDALFIPEIRFEPGVGAKAFYVFGHYNGLGFSPFSIESTDNPEQEPIAKTYKILDQLAPLINQYQGSKNIDGVWLTKENPETQLTFGDYIFTLKHDLTLGWSPEAKLEDWPEAGAIIIQTASEEFYVAGTGVVISFRVKSSPTLKAGIDSIYEGEFQSGQWLPGRSMNGDQSHQGRHLRIPNNTWGIQKLKLYKYQ